MIYWLKYIFLKLNLFIHSLIVRISISLYNTENELLRTNPDDLKEDDKKITRKLHHNILLEKFNQGQRDEKYVTDYYLLLKKADEFMRNGNVVNIKAAIEKHNLNYGMFNDEHIGFYDKNHKYYGKDMVEINKIELENRKTNDDDYELLYIFNNKPIERGLSSIIDSVELNRNNVEVYNYINNTSKQFDFPIKVKHKKNNINNIAVLTDVLHVKKIGFEYRQLEFFIPLKYKTKELKKSNKIFKEIIDVLEVYMRDEYGDLIGFKVNKFIKRITTDTHEVIKFEAIELKK